MIVPGKRGVRTGAGGGHQGTRADPQRQRLRGVSPGRARWGAPAGARRKLQAGHTIKILHGFNGPSQSRLKM